jgi:hypothetical protein
MRSAAFVCVAFLLACSSTPLPDRTPPALAIAPQEVEMPPGVEQRFVAGTAPVAWSVAEGTSGGSIALDGTYTSPSDPGTYHVVAQRDGLSATATVRVTIAPGVSVGVDPPAADVGPGGSMQLKATVAGTPDRTVLWSIREGDAGGQIDGAGHYSAPLSTGLFHVVAVSEADPSKFASAAISVSAKPTITVSIDPPTAALKPGLGTRFNAAVTGTANTAVHWLVAEGAAGGTLDSQGRYVAPQGEGTFHLVAASDADPQQSATAEVKVARSVTVTVTPEVATVQPAGSRAFTVVVSGSDQRVAWSVVEGSAGGLVDSYGVYHAPPLPGVFHLVATSVADRSRSATAVITVPAETISVEANPSLSAVRPGERVQFSATVNGSPEKRVLWTAESGSITQDGAYTAPSSTGTFRVSAQSFADPTKKASAFVTVVADVVVGINPAQATVHAGDVLQLRADVAGTPDTAVAWSVDESAGGRVDSKGLYTAPRREGIFHVVATSHADASKRAVAVVTVSYFDLIDKGGPVLPATRTFALWWGDPKAWPADARPAQEALLSGLDGSGYLGIVDEYMRGKHATTSFGGSLFDPSPPPPIGDPATIGDHACAALRVAGVAPTPGDFVIVYGAAALATPSYCAWHWYTTCGTTTVLTAWVPNPAGTSCLPPPTSCNSLSAEANALASSTAHELMEAITNPYATSWLDPEGEEVADKCEADLRCVRIGANRFQIQSEYSNDAHACVVP